MKTALLIIAFFTLGAAGPALAQEGDPTGTSKILVLDNQRLAEEPAALQSLYAQVDEAQTREIVAYNSALDALETEFAPIAENKETTDIDTYQRALESFNQAVGQLDQALQEAQDGINTSAGQALEKFETVRIEAEAAVLARYGATEFVDTGNVFYIRPGTGYDKTDEVVAYIDGKLPGLTLEKPSAE